MQTQTIPSFLEAVPARDRVDADVREDLRAGREPFGRIMEALARVPEGGVLRVRAIFEPVPLYRVMAGKGFDHWTEQIGPDDWRVWFHPPGLAEREDRAGRADEVTARDGEAHGIPADRVPADAVVLDVRGLEPPEPMVRTLEALEELPEGRTLLQVNVRVPRFLLPELEARGFVWEVDQETAPDRVFVSIRRAPAAG